MYLKNEEAKDQNQNDNTLIGILKNKIETSTIFISKLNYKPRKVKNAVKIWPVNKLNKNAHPPVKIKVPTMKKYEIKLPICAIL
jgi:hypothetical protein